MIRAPDDRGFDTIALRLPDGHLAVDREFLDAIGIKAALPRRLRTGNRYFDLDRLQGIDYAIDQCTQTLAVDASRLKARQQVSLRGRKQGDADRRRAKAGGFVEFDAQLQNVDGRDRFTALSRAAYFSAGKQLDSSLLLDQRRSTRLETRWTLPVPEALATLRFGDSVSRPGVLNVAHRFAGLQWGTDFALQPDLVTFPLPSTLATANLPSSVDVYINDVRRGQAQVDSGPFQITDIPGLNGDGRIRLVVTDMLGRSRVVEYEIYTAPQLLRAGLSQYQIATGLLRENYGQRSDDYGAGFVSGQYRTGLDDRLTLDSEFEVGDRQLVGGVGYGALFGNLGVLQMSLAQSAGAHAGGQIRVSAERVGAEWTLRSQWQRSSADFRRVGDTYAPSQRRILAGVSWRNRRIGAVSTNWFDDLPASGDATRSIAVGYSPRTVAGFQASLSARFDLEQDDRDAYFLLLSRPLGARVHASATAQRSGDDTIFGAQVSTSTAGPLGLRTQAGVTAGDRRRVYASGLYTDPRAVLSGQAERFEDSHAWRIGARSALVALGQDVFWTRPLDGPFAVVDTRPAQQVAIRLDNQNVGRTDRDGLLLVPNLRPYEPNRIAISMSSMPLDARIDQYEKTVTPPGYGGVGVSFSPHAGASRRLRLVLDDGTFPPPGADTAIVETGATGFVGFDGETSVSGTAGDYLLRARWRDRSCSARFMLTESARLTDPPQTITCHMD